MATLALITTLILQLVPFILKQHIPIEEAKGVEIVLDKISMVFLLLVLYFNGGFLKNHIKVFTLTLVILFSLLAVKNFLVARESSQTKDHFMEINNQLEFSQIN